MITFLLSLVILSILLRTDGPLDRDLVVPELTDDLDSYLLESESKFTDIRPGTEKKIIWQNPNQKSKTQYSIIYLHGFSASRQETAPLCDLVAQKLNANLFYTRLTGHGRNGDAMGEATVHDWKQDAVDALTIGQQLGEEVIVIGSSTGGTLAAWLAHWDNNQSVAALVLLSPNFGPRDKFSFLLVWPGSELFVPLLLGEERSWRPYNELQAQYWSTRYPTVALLSMMQLVTQARKLHFKDIEIPTLFVYSEKDKVVDYKQTRDVYNDFLISSRDVILVNESGEPSNHVLAGDILSPNNTEPLANELVRFLQKLH